MRILNQIFPSKNFFIKQILINLANRKKLFLSIKKYNK